MAYTDIANMTALQKHASFFDRNKDGIITPSETFEGNCGYTLNSVKSKFFLRVQNHMCSQTAALLIK
jgi:hypothetical protein